MRKFVFVVIALLLVTLINTSLVEAQEGGETTISIVGCEDYTVQADDWLSKIAEKYLGDIFAYSAIAEATNAAVTDSGPYDSIDDPNLIEIGQRLCIPNEGAIGAIETGVASVNDIQMYYEIFGEGKPLVLIHGGLGNADYWESQIAAFSEQYQVIAPDSRGHGRSTFSEQTIGYSLMASDVLALMDHLGVEKFDLVGWSDGGIIGLDLAINHPERVNKIVAYGANYSVSGLRSDIEEDETFNTYIEKTIEDYLKLSPTPDQLDPFLENISTMWSTEPEYTSEQLGGITVPMLILDGDNDEAILTEHTEEMAGLISTSELFLIPGTGHFAMWEKPEEFNQIVLDYLAK